MPILGDTQPEVYFHVDDVKESSPSTTHTLTVSKETTEVFCTATLLAMSPITSKVVTVTRTGEFRVAMVTSANSPNIGQWLST